MQLAEELTSGNTSRVSQGEGASLYQKEMRYGPVSGLIQKLPETSAGHRPGAPYAFSAQGRGNHGRLLYQPVSASDLRYHRPGKAGPKRSLVMSDPAFMHYYQANQHRDGMAVQPGYRTLYPGQSAAQYHHEARAAPPAAKRCRITPALLANCNLEQLVVLFNEEFEKFVGSFGYRVRLRSQQEQQYVSSACQATIPSEEERILRQAPPSTVPSRAPRNFTVLHTERVSMPQSPREPAITSRATEAARAAALEVSLAAEALQGRYRPNSERDKAISHQAMSAAGEMPNVRANSASISGQTRRRELSGHLCVACLRQAVFVCSKCQRTWYCSRECQVSQELVGFDVLK